MQFVKKYNKLLDQERERIKKSSEQYLENIQKKLDHLLETITRFGIAVKAMIASGMEMGWNSSN